MNAIVTCCSCGKEGIDPDKHRCIPELKEEVAALKAGLMDKQKYILELERSVSAHTEVAESLHKEIERLDKWVNDLQSGMYINCVYCGHRYGPNDKVPGTMADALKEHIETCPKHPMAALKQENERLRQELADAAPMTEEEKTACEIFSTNVALAMRVSKLEQSLAAAEARERELREKVEKWANKTLTLDNKALTELEQLLRSRK